MVTETSVSADQPADADDDPTDHGARVAPSAADAAGGAPVPSRRSKASGPNKRKRRTGPGPAASSGGSQAHDAPGQPDDALPTVSTMPTASTMPTVSTMSDGETPIEPGAPEMVPAAVLVDEPDGAAGRSMFGDPDPQRSGPRPTREGYLGAAPTGGAEEAGRRLPPSGDAIGVSRADVGPVEVSAHRHGGQLRPPRLHTRALDGLAYLLRRVLTIWLPIALLVGIVYVSVVTFVAG